jgi:hypothetical protein
LVWIQRKNLQHIKQSLFSVKLWVALNSFSWFLISLTRNWQLFMAYHTWDKISGDTS